MSNRFGIVISVMMCVLMAVAAGACSQSTSGRLEPKAMEKASTSKEQLYVEKRTEKTPAREETPVERKAEGPLRDAGPLDRVSTPEERPEPLYPDGVPCPSEEEFKTMSCRELLAGWKKLIPSVRRCNADGDCVLVDTPPYGCPCYHSISINGEAIHNAGRVCAERYIKFFKPRCKDDEKLYREQYACDTTQPTAPFCYKEKGQSDGVCGRRDSESCG